MQCQICNKNDATIHLTEIADGVRTEMHICEQCGSGVPEGDNCVCGAFWCELCETYAREEEAMDEPNQCQDCVVSRAQAKAEAYQEIV